MLDSWRKTWYIYGKKLSSCIFISRQSFFITDSEFQYNKRIKKCKTKLGIDQSISIWLFNWYQMPLKSHEKKLYIRSDRHRTIIIFKMIFFKYLSFFSPKVGANLWLPWRLAEMVLTNPRTGRQSIAGNIPRKTGTYLHLDRVRK